MTPSHELAVQNQLGMKHPDDVGRMKFDGAAKTDSVNRLDAAGKTDGAAKPNGTGKTDTEVRLESEPKADGAAPAAERMHFELSDTMLMLPFAEARAQALRDFDRYFLSAALGRHAGNVARTARALGLHRQSLQKLMARRGLKSGRITVPAST